MRIIHCILIMLCVVAMDVAAARAAWTPSSLVRWVGLGKEKASPATDVTHSTSRMPVMVTKMTDGTKRLVTSTTSKLTPKKTTTQKSGTTGFQPAQNLRQEKPGFFKSLFHPEPPPPPKTIKEWMSLKQIHP